MNNINTCNTVPGPIRYDRTDNCPLRNVTVMQVCTVHAAKHTAFEMLRICMSSSFAVTASRIDLNRRCGWSSWYREESEFFICSFFLFGPILWGHSGPLCHALSLLSLLLLWRSILHCHSPGVATVARRLRYSYSWLRLIWVVVSIVVTPGEWQCKIRIGGVRRLAVANGPNIFQMLLVVYSVSGTVR